LMLTNKTRMSSFLQV